MNKTNLGHAMMRGGLFGTFGPLDFEFVSDLGFRVSDFALACERHDG
jgi:hypothetical protein